MTKLTHDLNPIFPSFSTFACTQQMEDWHILYLQLRMITQEQLWMNVRGSSQKFLIGMQILPGDFEEKSCTWTFRMTRSWQVITKTRSTHFCKYAFHSDVEQLRQGNNKLVLSDSEIESFVKYVGGCLTDVGAIVSSSVRGHSPVGNSHTLEEVLRCKQRQYPKWSQTVWWQWWECSREFSKSQFKQKTRMLRKANGNSVTRS